MRTITSELFVPLFLVMAETVVPTSWCEDQLETNLLSFRAGGSAMGGPSTERHVATWPQL